MPKHIMIPGSYGVAKRNFLAAYKGYVRSLSNQALQEHAELILGEDFPVKPENLPRNRQLRYCIQLMQVAWDTYVFKRHGEGLDDYLEGADFGSFIKSVKFPLYREPTKENQDHADTEKKG